MHGQRGGKKAFFTDAGLQVTAQVGLDHLARRWVGSVSVSVSGLESGSGSGSGSGSELDAALVLW